MLKEAGLDRINHNLNSSRSFYPEICSTHTYDQRVNNIKMLQGLGFEICSGGIIGMGESKEDVVDMLMDLKAISPESVPINFLLPIPGTRLADRDISGLTPGILHEGTLPGKTDDPEVRYPLCCGKRSLF